MRKLFISVCPGEELDFLPAGIETQLFSVPIYELTYKKIENAVSLLGLSVSCVRVSANGLPNTSREINAGLEDIVIVASPFTFLAGSKDIEGAIGFVARNEMGYATVGALRNLYMTVGLGKMVSKTAVGSPADFVTAILNNGAKCDHRTYAEAELSAPVSKLNLLTRAERARQEFLDFFILSGVEIEARDGIVISPLATIGKGAKILTGSHIGPDCVIREGAVIGPNAVIEKSEIGEGSVVNFSKVENSVLGRDITIDPFCYIKGDSHIISSTRIESYTELINTTVNANAKIGSHCRLVDTEVGARVVIGSGVVTVSYEINKKLSKCKINDDAIIGCNSALILPLVVGVGAFVAAGSAITDNVPAGALAIAREYQSNHEGWASRRKNNVKHI
ncbi:MAG: hypothetical protein J6B34_05565 [Clostridia bacterium]|nr:hypothetical protein [Clostridia bacterium]